MKDMKRKVVYALEMSNDTVKIGISSRIDQRIQELKNASGMDVLNIYKTKKLPHKLAMAIEAAAHKYFADVRLNGEYFNADFADVVNYLRKQEKLGGRDETVVDSNSATTSSMKAIDKVFKEICDIIKRYDSFWFRIYIDNGKEVCFADKAYSPYMAGMLAIKCAVTFQADYKKLGEPHYTEYRAGMRDMAAGLGVQLVGALGSEATNHD